MTASGDPEKVDLASPDLAAAHREALEAAFPGVLADGVLDVPRLAELLDVEVAGVADGRERYGLMWAGKAEAVRSLLTPSHATLVPDFERSIDFDTAQNVFIEGDNLEVLKLLQKAYNDKVKLIYIDPPYNTGNDFVYNDDFSDGLRGYLEYTGQVDEDGNRTSANADTQGRRHSRWLSMMYPRLVLARNLLRQDGAIAISIDDNEVASLRLMLDEVFGRENFVSQLIWKSKSGGANDARWMAIDHEYVLVYARSANDFSVNLDANATVTTAYPYSDADGDYGLERLDKQSIRYSASLDYEIVGPDGSKYRPRHKDPKHPNASWRWSKGKVEERYAELVFKDGNVYTKNYRKNGAIARSLLVEERFGRTRTGKTELAKLIDGAPFDNPKPPSLIAYLVEVLSDPGDVVLDFFAGSGTTGDAVMRVGEGRRTVLVQLPEPTHPGSPAAERGYKLISEITIERLRAAAEHLGVSGTCRVLALHDSPFTTEIRSGAGQLNLSDRTLALGAERIRELPMGIFLHEGVAADEPWNWQRCGEAESVTAGSVSIVLSLDLVPEAIESALALDAPVVVFLEDGFAGKDALKANAMTNAKNRGITMKTV